MGNYYLEQPMAPGEHDYAIIDRMQYPDIHETWPVLELVSPMFKPQAHLYPWLLPLKEMHAGEWKALMEKPGQTDSSQKAPVSCLLLRSERSSSDIRNQLIRSLYFTDENRQGHILRYYDPRVFFHLCWMLSPWQLAQTFPSHMASHWTFWLEDRWHTVRFPSVETAQPGGSQTLSLQQLQRCGLINQVLGRFSSYGDVVLREQVSQRVDALLAKAMELGLPTAEDQVAFAFYGLGLRDAFWTSPKLLPLLQQARKAPDFFHDETRFWDEERWNMMTRR
ncbi:DUF4123 domain-containing protein [Klebsiella aerogenes]